MILEPFLASLHIVAILAMVVFSSSQAALCREEWLNAAVVRRLLRLDWIFLTAVALLLLSGVARVVWGIKGWQWYVGQPLFHVKMTLVLLTLLIVTRPSLAIRRWVRTLEASGALPGAQEINRVRRAIMLHTHVMPVIAVVAVFWARGW
ncbi:DUF2214 family protein [Comamonas nitrativorans]|uniref:DUF2214 family protein n=1 Tax=Comamonas nitrativorans TaxID=108437 RepID=A0ABV9GZN7_9BURK